MKRSVSVNNTDMTLRCVRVDHSGSFLRVKRAADVEILNRSLLRCLAQNCGNPRLAAAARTWQPLPLTPPPADLESAVPLLPFDNTINRSIREPVRRHPTSKNAPRGASWKGDAVSSSARTDGVKMHNITECVLLCACSVKGEDRGSEGVDEMIT